MRTLRAAFKLTILVLFTFPAVTMYVICRWVLMLFGLNRFGWRNAFMRFWAKGASRILNIHTTIEGKPPRPPFFLVSNHLSYIDIIPIYLSTKATFVAKKEVRSWPFIGFMVSQMDVIFVDRSRKRDVTRVNEQITKGLNEQQGMIVFPEGTTTGGDRVLPFRSPLLQFPAEEEMPVHFSAISYQTDEANGDPPAQESVCYYGGRDPFQKHLLKLAGNRKIYCTIRFGEETVTHSDRKELGDRLHKKVAHTAGLPAKP